MNTSSTLVSPPEVDAPCPSWCSDHQDASAAIGEAYGWHRGHRLALGSHVEIRLEEPVSDNADDDCTPTMEIQTSEGVIDLPVSDIQQITSAMVSLASSHPQYLSGEHRMVAETEEADQ